MTENTLNTTLPSRKQVDAAQALYRDPHMEYWRLEDTTMGELKDNDPYITDKAITLIKATLVNTFYGAGCPDVDDMTKWMVKLKLKECYLSIASPDNEDEYIKLVQEIARCTPRSKASKTGAQVFAAKFAHFFIDSEHFPIFDQYAAMMVAFHLKSSDTYTSLQGNYALFHHQFFELKRRFNEKEVSAYSTKELDHYLWLSGMYVTWQRWNSKYCQNPDSKYDLNLYKPARKLFEGANNPHLNDLFPADLLQGFPEDLLHALPKWKNAEKAMKRKQRKAEGERIQDER